jgi:myo-inositol-1(or 4)-monophosphatase
MRDTSLLQLCISLARQGGDHAARCRQAGLGDLDHKSSATDVVTQCDRSAEKLIVDRIRAERPEDSIIGEEGATITGSSGLVWHLDPIDGTTNFVYGGHAWCTSVAVSDAQGSLAGAVYLPVTQELFSAFRGAGATLNGLAIRCSEATQLGQALVATGFSYDSTRREVQAARLSTLIGSIRDIRRSGSAAVDLCSVACGRVDAYYEDNLNSWDIAAGELIACEAGAISSGFDAGPSTPAHLVVAAPGIHASLQAMIGATVTV